MAVKCITFLRQVKEKKQSVVERKCPRTLEALTAERTMSRQRNINPAPSAAPLFLTDASELVHSLPLVREHGGFQGVEDAGWKTEVASHEHFSLQLFSS